MICAAKNMLCALLEGKAGLMFQAHRIRRCMRKGDSAFLFFTDANWGENYRLYPAIIKYLAEHAGITRIFFGGDFITHSAPYLHGQ